MTDQPPMTHQEMLDKMGIKEPHFTNYWKAYKDFYDKLNADQKAFHHRNTPTKTVHEIAQSLGPNARPADVEALFQDAPNASVTLFSRCCG